MKEDCDVDDLVDVIEGSRVYIPCIYVINKIDQARQPLSGFSCIVFEKPVIPAIPSPACFVQGSRVDIPCIYVINKIEWCAANPLERRSLEI